MGSYARAFLLLVAALVLVACGGGGPTQEWEDAIDTCGAKPPWVQILSSEEAAQEYGEEYGESPAIVVGSKADHPDQFDAEVALCLAEELDWEKETDFYRDMAERE